MNYFLGSSHTHQFKLTIKFVVSSSTFEFNINISKKQRKYFILVVEKQFWGCFRLLGCNAQAGAIPSDISAVLIEMWISTKFNPYENHLQFVVNINCIRTWIRVARERQRKGIFLCNNTTLVIDQILSFMRVMLIQPCRALNRWYLMFNYLHIHLSQQLEECSTQCLRPSQVLRLDFHERYCRVKKQKTNKTNYLPACCIMV